MVDLDFKLKDAPGTSFSLPVNARHQIKLTPPTVEVLDVEDSHFNFDRKVLLPDLSDRDGSEPVLDKRRVTGLGVIYAALVHARENSEQGLTVTGHTDASGKADYNQKLSEQRAENVSLLLRGKRDEWRKQAAADDAVDDYQTVLLWQHQRAGWDCDPGAIDNQLNAQTKQAIGRFQELYNLEVDKAQADGLDSPFKAKITADKKVGAETWGAIYDVYMSELMDLLELDKFSDLEAMQQALKPPSGMPDFVGCGEHIPFNPARRDPLEKGNQEHAEGPQKNPSDRRVEILFFDPGEEVELACHAAKGQCKPDACPLYTLNPHRQSPIEVPSGLTIAEVNLRVTYVDPEGVVRPFPAGMEVEAKFGDPKDDPGAFESSETESAESSEPASPNEPESLEVDQEPNEKIGDDGLLRFVIPRKASSLYLRFIPGLDVRFVSADPKEPNDQKLVKFTEAQSQVKEGRVFFELPPEFNTREGYFELPVTPETVTFFDGVFLNVDIRRTQIGSRAAPLELRLKLHWQYFKFEYFDRFTASLASVPQNAKDAAGKAGPPLVLEGTAELVEADAPFPAQFARSAWSVATGNDVVHCLAWPTRNIASDDTRRELPDANCTVCFRARDVFVRTDGDGSSPSAPRFLASVPPQDAVLTKVGIERLRLYDLPIEWRSRLYPTRIAGEGTDKSRAFEQAVTTLSTQDKPYLISLDVIVMRAVDDDKAADTTLALDDSTLNNRFTIFDNAMRVFKPDPNKSYFTRSADLKPPPKNGVLVDFAPFTRAITHLGVVYSVFEQRTIQAAGFKGTPVGARLAVPVPTTIDSTPLLASAVPFTAPRPNATRTPPVDLGSSTLVVFRCCGHDKGVELFIVFQYVCVSFIFPKPLDPAARASSVLLKNSVELDAPPANAEALIRNCLVGISNRWTGRDGVNSTPTTFEVGSPLVARGTYVARLHQGGRTTFASLEQSEILVTVLKRTRAFMQDRQGFWQLSNMSPNGESFTAAHEFGHTFSQPDEYFNTDFEPSYGFNNISEAFRSPGTPYGPDGRAMMTGGEIEVRARYFWDFLLFAQQRDHFKAETRVVVKRGPIALSTDLTPPDQTRTRLPVVEKTDVTFSKFGLCDLFVYLMGRDEFTAGAIDSLASANPYDGIVMVRVKMHWTFPTMSDFQSVQALLSRASNAISSAFNNTPLTLQALVSGRRVRLRVKFAPRFVCSTFPTGPGANSYLGSLAPALPQPFQAADYTKRAADNIKDNKVHVNVTVNSGTPGISAATVPRPALVQLDVGGILGIFSSSRFDRDVVKVFSQLVGLEDAPQKAADFAPLLGALVPEVTAAVASFNP